MQHLTNISNPDAPKVFGHLYIAIFSNGTVKAGMSGRSPGDRVNSHANAGKAFGISMDSSFCVSIYTDDTKARERLMHQEISALATLTAGREWFKFDDATMAVNFASAYLCKVERMSFAERPSAEELAARGKVRNSKLESIFPTLFIEPVRTVLPFGPATSDELEKMAALLHGYSLSVVASMANKVMLLEERATMNCEDMDLKMPILRAVIDAHYDEQNRIHTACANGTQSPADDALVQESLVNGHTLDKVTAIKIIQATAHYPEFFCEAMGFKVAA